MPKKKSLSVQKVEDVREKQSVRREIVEAVRILVIAMNQKKLPDGTDLVRETRMIASEMARIKLASQEIIVVFREAIENSEVKVDGLNLIKVLEIVFALAVPTIAASMRAASRGHRKMAAAV